MPEHVTPVLIYESSLDGHRAHYVKTILDELVAQGVRPVVILPFKGAGSTEFQVQFASLLSAVDWDFCIPPHPSSGWKNGWLRLQALLGSIRKWQPRIVLIPSGDVLAYFMCCAWLWWWHPAVRAAQIHIGLHRLRFGYPLRNRADGASRLFMRLALMLAPVRRYFSVDEIPVEAAGGSGPMRLSRLHVMPDPITPATRLGRSAARERLGLPADAALIGLVGVIDERKGALTLVRALPELFKQTKARVVFAGKQSAGVRSAIASLGSDPALGGRLLSIDRFLETEEVLWWVEALDVICLLQPGHIGISSFVLRADQLGVPVLGSTTGWVGRQIHNHHLGWTVDPGDRDAIVRVIVAAMAEVEAGRRPAPAGTLVAKNSAALFLAAFLPPEFQGDKPSSPFPLSGHGPA